MITTVFEENSSLSFFSSKHYQNILKVDKIISQSDTGDEVLRSDFYNNIQLEMELEKCAANAVRVVPFLFSHARCTDFFLIKGPVRRAVWPLRLQSGSTAAEPLLKRLH